MAVARRPHRPTILVALVAIVMGGGVALSVLATVPSPGRAAPAPDFPPLTLNATATPMSGPVPLTVAFSALAGGGLAPYSYNWSFGDGSPNATTASVNHTYRWIALFHANVTAVDYLGEIVTRDLTVDAVPAALVVALSATPSAVASGGTTYLETSVEGGVPPYHYVWEGLPIGCPSQSVENLSCTPSYGGSYVVNVTVSDSQGRSAWSVVGLVVSGPPPPGKPNPPGPAPPDYTYDIVAVAALGSVAVVLAALIGRRARRRRA